VARAPVPAAPAAAAPPAGARLRPVRRTTAFPGLRTIAALMLREMSSSYGRSPGGYLWVVVEPVLGILFMAAIFVTIGIRTPALGTNFAIFFATGILPFALYNDLGGKVGQAINYSKALLNYPRVTYVDAILARVLLALMTQALVFVLIIGAIRGLWETRTVIVVERVLLSLSMATALGVGVGLMNCFVMTQFPLWQRIWGILMRPMFFLSGILLLYESIPQPWNAYYLWNPLVHVTAEMRAAFYPGYDATYVDPVFVFGWAFGLGLTGLVFLHRYHRDILEL
jgi:capsular polysaccharide transport system permease protein